MLRPELDIDLNPDLPSPGTRTSVRQGLWTNGSGPKQEYRWELFTQPLRFTRADPIYGAARLNSYFLRPSFVMGNFLCGEQSRGSHCCAHSGVGSGTSEDQMSSHPTGPRAIGGPRELRIEARHRRSCDDIPQTSHYLLHCVHSSANHDSAHHTGSYP